MIQFRPFLNSDSPGIAAVWNSQPPLRGRLSSFSSAELEQHVLSKPHFDPEGLIVAVADTRVVGFIHVGFQPIQQHGQVNTEFGVIFQLLWDPRSSSEAAAQDLLRCGEDYLCDRGARAYVGGAVGSRGPYYLGVYGGSNLPGVLAGDAVWQSQLLGAGYVASQERIVLQRSLTDFRPPMDRQFMQLRRQFRLEQLAETEIERWDEACAWCWIDRIQFAVVPASGGAAQASFAFWNIEPLSSSWGIRAEGLLDAPTTDDSAPADLTVCFIGEALRQFQSQGVSMIEIQIDASDAKGSEGYRRLGFQEADRGTQYRKPV